MKTLDLRCECEGAVSCLESWGNKESVDELTTLYRDVRYGGKDDNEPERKTAKGIFKKLKELAESKKTA